MQTWNFAILLLVFHTTNSIKKDIKQDKMIAPLMKKCSTIKCPPVHEPVCARVYYNQTRFVHAILINKCEMKYVECNPGVQAKLVPMKFCSHDHLVTKGETKGHELKAKRNGFGNKRVKRGISRDGDNNNEVNNEDGQNTMLIKQSAEVAHDKKLLSKLPTEDASDDETVINSSNDKKNLPISTEEEDSGSSFVGLSEDEQENKKPKRGRKKLPQMLSDVDPYFPLGGNEHGQLQNGKQSGSSNGQYGVDYFTKKGPALFFTEDVEVYTKKGPAAFVKREDDEDIEFVRGFNWRQEYPKANMKNYEAECPKICPIRPVMVCGRCEHGIYTTFLSICHMRMHYCNFKNDTIELVARYPCMMSAPLMKVNDSTHPLGKVNEPNDDDKVLRYIWCRDRSHKGAYCQTKTEKVLLSGKNEDEEELNDSEDTDNLPMNVGEDSENSNLAEDYSANFPLHGKEDPVNLPMNSEEETEDLPMNAEEETEDLPMNAEEETEDLPMNAEEETEDLPMNAEEETEDLPMNAEKETEDLPMNAKEQAEELPMNAKEGAEDLPMNVEEGAPDLPMNVEEGAQDLPMNAEQGAEDLPMKAEEPAEKFPMNAEEEAKELLTNAEEEAKELPTNAEEKAEALPIEVKE